MNKTTIDGLTVAVAVLTLALSQAWAFSNAEDFFKPGNNAMWTAIPDPGHPGYCRDGVSLIATDMQIQSAVCTYSGFPAGTFNNRAGITILVSAGYGEYFVPRFNAMNLTVGNLGELKNYSPGLFSHVFGIYQADTFGFAGANFLYDFGISGTPVFFGEDGAQQDGNRFLGNEGLQAGNRLAFESTPTFVPTPDGGVTIASLSGAFAALLFFRRALVRA